MFLRLNKLYLISLNIAWNARSERYCIDSEKGKLIENYLTKLFYRFLPSSKTNPSKYDHLWLQINRSFSWGLSTSDRQIELLKKQTHLGLYVALYLL